MERSHIAYLLIAFMAAAFIGSCFYAWYHAHDRSMRRRLVREARQRRADGKPD